MIGDDDRAFLLRTARRALEAAVRGGSFMPEIPKRGPAAEKRGAFVTLTRDGALRGCIGRIVADEPLAVVVAEMARAAALDDPRFPPVGEDELEAIDIEISAMSPVRRVSGPEEIVVGRDGLIIRKGPRSGLLLPQVASERGWDAVRFLDETCRKAALPPDAWKEGAAIETFRAEVWSE